MSSVMCSELRIMPEISRPPRPSACEHQSAECALTSPVSTESGMLMTCRMQHAMSVSTVL